MSSLFGQKAPGLSVNTGSANTLFASGNANSSQPPPAGGLFGGSAPATSQAGGGMFGTSTSTAASAGTLFGTSTTATTTQGGGLFGNTATAPATNAGTLFGGAAAAQGGSLFGQNKPQPAQPQPSGGLFGQSTQQPAGGGGLFGTAQPQQQTGGMFGTAPSQPAGTSLFGTAPQQASSNIFGGQSQFGNTSQITQQQQPGGSLFTTAKPGASIFNPGATQQAQNPQKQNFTPSNSTLYPTQQPQRSTFSASIGQYTAAQQTIPGVRVDLSNLRPTTRFEDLHESLQKEIADLDQFILNQIQMHDECDSVLPRVSEMINSIPTDAEYLDRKLKVTQQSLETDAAMIEEGRALVKADAEDARRSFKAIHALKMPSQFHVTGMWSGSTSSATASGPGALAEGETVDAEKDSADLVRYFSQQADAMEKKLEGFKKNLGEVETYLAGIEAQTIAKVQSARMGQAGDNGPKSSEDKVRELAGVLREFEGGILKVASAVGGVREQVQEVMLSDSRMVRWNRR